MDDEGLTGPLEHLPSALEPARDHELIAGADLRHRAVGGSDPAPPREDAAVLDLCIADATSARVALPDACIEALRRVLELHPGALQRVPIDEPVGRRQVGLSRVGDDRAQADEGGA